MKMDANIPPHATFWIPSLEDIGEEGFGFFHDTWAITDVTLDEARGILEEEERIIAFVDDVATSPDIFEKILKIIESGEMTEMPPDLLSAEQCSNLEEILIGEDSPIRQLDLGVVSSVYSFSAAGCFPAASCRGHGSGYSWASNPVVYIAADRPHAEAIQPLVAESGCGLALDEVRPDLIVVQAPSIREMLTLSSMLIHRIDDGLPTMQPTQL
ncbi:hypothetical protein QLQ12_11605 [Actinoplanes sp. NEAU-A12]|uniref:RES domain-containing protein n=1 Tax=Actinoplanes sandaracinus TaxID=3045177 RepID=A0ABT6WHN0_9ACTN|nr:hypothetical protein [Actinoplanes sandaracinus]